MAKHGLWMPMYWATYFANTTHLTTFQHGMYLLLIGAYWERGGPIPADPASVAQIARTTKDKLARYGNPVLAMFTCKDDLLHHEFIDSQILKSSDRIAAAVANGMAGGLAKSKLTTITNTKERKKRAVAPPSVNGSVAPALPAGMTPERLEELKDRTNRIMKRGKYQETFK